MTKPNKVFHREGGDKYLSTFPPLAWGYTPLYGGPSPRIPPYIGQNVSFGGDNTMSNAKKIFGKKMSFFGYLLGYEKDN